MDIKTNRVKHKLDNGQVATVLLAELTADLIETFGRLGFDGMWIEAEHGSIDFQQVRNMTRACDLWDIASVARVHANIPGLIYRTLDQGVQNILVPHVNTAEEASEVVDAAKFPPIGHRGNYTSRQGYGVEDYVLKANDEVIVGILIEDIIAINNLEDILTVDGLDLCFVATGDLSNSMGYPGRPEHPEVIKVRNQAIEKIAESDKIAGTVTTEKDVDEMIQMGARLVTTGYQSWVEEGAAKYLREIKNSIIK